MPEKRKTNIQHLYQSFPYRISIALIIVVGLIVYASSLSNGFVGDDSGQIVNNPLIQSASNILKLFYKSTFYDYGASQTNNYYRPITSIVFSVVYSLFGANPFAFHLLQLLIHISNAIFVFLILNKFIKKEISLVLALIFLIHPINSESVVNISSMQETLFLFFGLLALFSIHSKHIDRAVNIITGTLLLVLSVLSKESGFLFIIILPVYGYIINKTIWRHIFQGLFATSIYLLLRFSLAEIPINEMVISPIMTLSLWERIYNIPKIIYIYLKTFFVPTDITVLQDWTVKSINLSNFYIPLLFILMFSACLIAIYTYIYHNHKNFTSTYQLFIIWLVVGICAHTQIFPLDQTLAYRWFYFPIVGLLGVIGLVIQLNGFAQKSRLFIVFAAIILSILSTRTIIRNTNWKNNYTLCSHDLQVSEPSSLLEGCVGYELFQKGKAKESEIHFLNAVKIFPSSNTYSNLGNYYLFSDQLAKARESYLQALEYQDTPKTSIGLVRVYIRSNDYASAKTHLEQSLSLYPNYADLWGYSAFVEYKLGNKSQAVNQVKQAYQISKDPKYLVLLENIQVNKDFIVH